MEFLRIEQVLIDEVFALRVRQKSRVHGCKYSPCFKLYFHVAFAVRRPEKIAVKHSFTHCAAYEAAFVRIFLHIVEHLQLSRNVGKNFQI